jgi:hypothetical protein
MFGALYTRHAELAFWMSSACAATAAVGLAVLRIGPHRA